MTTETISGTEFLLKLFADVSDPEDGWPLGSHIEISSYLAEDWDSQTADLDAENLSLNFKSGGGSVLSFSNVKSESDTNGSTASAFRLTTPRGDSALVNTSERWSGSDSSQAIRANWKYIGDSSDKTDDFNYRLQISGSKTESSGRYREVSAASLSFANADYKFNVVINTTDDWQSADTGTAVDNSLVTFSKYEFADLVNDFSVKFSGVSFNDDIAGTMNINLKNLKMETSDYEMTMPSYKEIISQSLLEDVEILPQSSLGSIYGSVPQLEAVFMRGNNQLKVTAPDGVTLDAGRGNDTVLGGAGSDVLSGGEGRDQISGGGGADIFSFSRTDSSAIASAADVVTDFKSAEGDQIRLLGLTDIRCAVAAQPQKTFALALAAAMQDFADGSNISFQFVGKNGVLLVDYNSDQSADLAVMLTGLKSGAPSLVDYAESGEMFA